MLIQRVLRLLPPALFLASSIFGHAAIRINEVMASNARSFPDIVDFEDYPDWIELSNDSNEEAKLGGLYLTDNPAQPLKWTIPAGTTIPANGFLLIMADGNDADIGESHPRGYWPWRNFSTERLHANFSLSAEGETLVLSQSTGEESNTLIELGSNWKYLDDGSSQGSPWKQRLFDDAAWASGPAPLGYNDDPVTELSFGDPDDRNITSFLRRDFSVADPAGIATLTVTMQVDDSCLLYLNGIEMIRHNLPEGVITNQTLSLVSASPPREADFHTYPFSAANLVAGNNVIAVEVHQSSTTSNDMRFDLMLEALSPVIPVQIDSLTFPQQVRDVSIGRDALSPEILRQFARGTPGAINIAFEVDDIRFSSEEVAFSPDADLYSTAQTITLSSDAGDIYYTLDGRNPTVQSSLYTVPFEVSETTVVRARCFESGKVPSPIMSRTYFIGETFKNLPFVSVTADPETLFGDAIGIYLNNHEPSRNVYKKKDAPGHLEFFPNDGSKGFAVNGGFRIGGENNWASHDQKALNFSLKGKYGDDEIKYDLFPGTGIPIHTGIALREGGDNWNNAMLRDSFWWYLAADHQLKVDTSARRPVVSFINGEYWGIYNLRDRWNEQWFHQHYGVDNGNYDHLGYGRFASSSTTLGAHHGEITEWDDLSENFIKVNDLTDPNNWAFIESRIDIDSYIDFVICESYGNNTSWRHNREFWKERKLGAKWRWFIPDMDRTWQNASGNVFSSMLNGSGLLSRLRVNPTFRARLAQRFSAHIASSFAPSRIHDLIDTLGPLLEPELERHVDRWDGDATTLERYADQIQLIRDFADVRGPVVVDQIRDGLALEDDVNLTLAVIGEGSLKLAGVKIPAITARVFPDLETTLEAIPAPGFSFSHWTGIAGPASTTFELSGDQTIIAHFIPDGASVISGELATNETWTAASSPYVIADDFIVPAGVTLTIAEGVRIQMESGRHFRVIGTLLSNGSEANPIMLEGRNGRPWGALSFENPTTTSVLNHLIVRHATRGKEPTIYPSAISGLNATIELNFVNIAECRAPLFFRGGSMILRDSFIHIPITGDGLNVKQGQALTERCTFLGNNSPDTDAIDYDGVINGVIRDCRIYSFLGFNSDGIDTGEQCQNVLIEGNRILFNSDKGISVGQGSSVVMRKNLIVGCPQGVGVKDAGSTIEIDQNTFVDCAEGVTVFEKNFGAGGGTALVANSIFSGCAIPVASDSLSVLTVNYSLSDTLFLAGSGNLNTHPKFRDPLALDFSLSSSSPAIDSGDPAHSNDPDGSIIDMGADYTFDPLDYPFDDLNTIVINEILANSGNDGDWIELHNRTNADINIGGWFLSDDGSNLTKYRIPEGLILAAGGFHVFFEDLNFGPTSVDPNVVTAFALSDTGETLHLSSAINNNLTGYRFSKDYGASNPGETVGYYFKPGTGTFNYVRLQSATMGSQNAPPKSGPVVISEIMYNVDGNEDAEYLELLNISERSVDLYSPTFDRGWKLDKGIDFEFPSGSNIAPGERIIVTRSTNAFTSEFTTPGGTQIFEWTDGKLSNSGDTIELEMPGLLNDLMETKFIRLDRVNYGTDAPWTSAADGTGLALSKISAHNYGNDATNWTALSPSPGSATTGTTYESWASGLSETDDEDHDGLSNLLEYALGTNPRRFDSGPGFDLTFRRTSLGLALAVPLDRGDVQVTLQKSNDLETWQAIELPPVRVTSTTQEMEASLPRTKAEEYYRLLVHKNP
ncbi:MAG: hypothetical protein ACJAQT_003612 [Akkermansiaceae bacterium]